MLAELAWAKLVLGRVVRNSQGRWQLAGRLTERCFNFSKIAEQKAKIPELECFQDKNTRKKGRVRIPLFPQKMHYSRHPWSYLKGS